MTIDDRAVVVVGSGPAGAMAAHTLVRRGIPVVMIESGLRPPRGLLVRAGGRDVLSRWPALTQELPHGATGDPNTRWMRNLVPGGLSNYWGGVIPRFAPEDFCDGRRLDQCYEWPVSYDELVPYYEQSEALLGVSGSAQSVPQLPAPRVALRRRLPAPWQQIAAHAAAAGHGLTSIPRAAGRAWTAQRSAAPFNSYAGIIRPMLNSPHFRLILGAHALRVGCTAEKQATHVVYFDRSAGCERRLNAAAVVLAAGPLGSTKLLLDSACAAFPDGLGNSEGALGRYLHDHTLTTFGLTLRTPVASLPDGAYLTRAGYQQSAPLAAAGYLLRTVPPRSARLLGPLAGRSNVLGCAIFGTVVPTEDRCVQLDPDRCDEFGLPLLNIQMRFTTEDARNLETARARLVDILDAAGYPSTETAAALSVQPPGSSMHFGGTARMHRSPRYGVVDAWNRLHAVPNVLVADAAAFTTAVEKNPTLTVMALAARAAGRLATDLKAA